LDKDREHLQTLSNESKRTASAMFNHQKNSQQYFDLIENSILPRSPKLFSLPTNRLDQPWLNNHFVRWIRTLRNAK